MNEKRIKVLHIVESFSSGTFDFIRELISEMQEFDHIVIHGIREDTPPDYEKLIKATKFIRIKNFQRDVNFVKDFFALIELIRILKNFTKENLIIHLHSSKAGFLGRVAAKLLKLDNFVIYTSHGASFLRKDVSFFKRSIYVLLEKVVTVCGGVVVACSESEADEFKKYGIDAIWINNGVKDYSNILEEKFKKEENKKIIIGNCGRIVHQKNPKLFNFIAQKFTKNDEIEFLWIGDGPLREELSSPNIKITGWISQEEAIEYLYRYVDIYLSTSLWEGLPLTVLQAMSLKKPLVLHRCVGNVDLVYEGINGFIFDDEKKAVSAINFLIENSDARISYGVNSYNIYLEKFNICKMITKYKELYRLLLSTGNEEGNKNTSLKNLNE